VSTVVDCIRHHNNFVVGAVAADYKCGNGGGDYPKVLLPQTRQQQPQRPARGKGQSNHGQ